MRGVPRDIKRDGGPASPKTHAQSIQAKQISTSTQKHRRIPYSSSRLPIVTMVNIAIAGTGRIAQTIAEVLRENPEHNIVTLSRKVCPTTQIHP
jgi:hypothetical protein